MQKPYPTWLQQHLAFLFILSFLFAISSAGIDAASARKDIKAKLRVNAAESEGPGSQPYAQQEFNVQRVPCAIYNRFTGNMPISSTHAAHNDVLQDEIIREHGHHAASPSPASFSSKKLDYMSGKDMKQRDTSRKKKSPFKLKQLHEVPSGPNPISNHMPSNRYRNDIPADLPANRLRKDMPVDRLRNDDEVQTFSSTPPFH